jgi:hypothetical protein
MNRGGRDSVARPVAPGARPLFFATFDEWGRIAIVSIVVTAVIWPWFSPAPRSTGFGIMLVVIVVVHGIYAMRRIPWIPALVAGMAGLQWVLAAWAAYDSPAANMLRIETVGPAIMTTMMVSPAQYFAYVVPAFAALVLGLYLPAFRESRSYQLGRREVAIPRNFRFECDLMVAGGVVAFLMAPFLPPVLRYVSVLATYLAFVGAVAQYLIGTRGWGWRILIAFTMQFVWSAVTAQFADLFLHMLFFIALVVYVRKPSATSIVTWSIVPVFMVLTLNGIKSDYRQEVTRAQLSLADYARVLARTFVQDATDPGTVLGPSNLGQNIARFNQGWIIARVIYWVPGSEPHAKGETVQRAVSGALLPRFLAPDKFVAGGENFTRFTGHQLHSNTSMNLSAAGEGYANFGKVGGWVFVFLYGLGIGAVFRVFLRLARRSVLWWAWAPYVLLWAVSAESGLGEVLNQVAKASFVMFVVIHVMPSWRQLLRGKGMPARAVAASPQAATA